MILAGDLKCRRQAQRSQHRRHAGRVARTGSRGVPLARGVRPGPAGKEPWRLRPPGQPRGSRRDLRTAGRARRVRGPARRAERRRRRRARPARVSSSAWTRRRRREELDAYYRANLQFHDRLVELAGNAKLLATYRRLVNELHLYRRASLAQAGALPVSTREHHDIVEKIAAGQAVAAGRALYDHVMGSRERMHRVHDATPRRPSPRAPRPEASMTTAAGRTCRSTAARTGGPTVRSWSSASMAASPTTSRRPFRRARALPGLARRTRHLPHRRQRRAVVHQSRTTCRS